MSDGAKPTLLVLASTYPRWRGDPEPGFVHELCKRLASAFLVIALVPDAPGADPDGALEGIDVIRYRYAPKAMQTLVNNGGIAGNLRRHPWKWLLMPGFIVAQFIYARRLLKRQRVDVIHAHWLLPQGMIAQALSAHSGVPFLVTSHGGDLFGLRGRVLTRLKRRVAAASSAMSVVSSAMRDEALRLDLNPPVLRVLPMGVDLRNRFVPDPGTERKKDTLLFVGRLVEKKGLRHLLDAMPMVLAQRPDAMLEIAGFGPEEAALRAQAATLGISEKVKFLGAMAQEALPALYRSASVFVAPFIRDDSGNQEGLPVVLMEAIGCGCPVMVGNVAGVADLLGEHAPEASVQGNDPGALAKAILSVLEQPTLAVKRAEAIRKMAIERIDWGVIANAYGELLMSIARRRAS